MRPSSASSRAWAASRTYVVIHSLGLEQYSYKVIRTCSSVLTSHSVWNPGLGGPLLSGSKYHKTEGSIEYNRLSLTLCQSLIKTKRDLKFLVKDTILALIKSLSNSSTYHSKLSRLRCTQVCDSNKLTATVA